MPHCKGDLLANKGRERRLRSSCLGTVPSSDPLVSANVRGRNGTLCLPSVPGDQAIRAVGAGNCSERAALVVIASVVGDCRVHVKLEFVLVKDCWEFLTCDGRGEAHKAESCDRESTRELHVVELEAG